MDLKYDHVFHKHTSKVENTIQHISWDFRLSRYTSPPIWTLARY